MELAGKRVRFMADDATRIPIRHDVLLEGVVSDQYPREHGVSVGDEYRVVMLDTGGSNHVAPRKTQPESVTNVAYTLAQKEGHHDTTLACVHHEALDVVASAESDASAPTVDAD